MQWFEGPRWRWGQDWYLLEEKDGEPAINSTIRETGLGLLMEAQLKTDRSRANSRQTSAVVGETVVDLGRKENGQIRTNEAVKRGTPDTESRPKKGRRPIIPPATSCCTGSHTPHHRLHCTALCPQSLSRHTIKALALLSRHGLYPTIHCAQSRTVALSCTLLSNFPPVSHGPLISPPVPAGLPIPNLTVASP